MADILIIDDAPGSVLTTAYTAERVLFVDHVADVTDQQISESSLILVDYELGSALPEGQQSNPFVPSNGVAVLELLRTRSIGNDRRKPGPAKGFAILTNEADKLFTLPGPYRAHAGANELNVDWIFEKPTLESADIFKRQIETLANFFGSISPWPRTNTSSITLHVKALLGLSLSPEPSWYQQAWKDVQRARPPFREIAEDTRGKSFFRWILQQVLPYPSFLIETAYVAGRMGTTRASLVQKSNEQPIRNILEGARYRGMLSDFFPEPRYWRSAIEQGLWEATSGNPFDLGALRELFGLDIPLTTVEEVVIPLGLDLLPEDSPRPISECVRLQLDDWPSFAQQPWARIAVVKSDRDGLLSSIVDIRDSSKVE